MKKILIAGLVALALTTAARQEAQAWSKTNFGIGINYGWEGGGNSVLWGALRGQNVPGAGDGGYQGKQGFGGFQGYPGYGSNQGPETYHAAPNTSAEPPLAPGNDSEKIAPPTPLRPAAFYPAQPWGNTPAYPTYPVYQTYPTYPTYPVYYSR